MLIEMQTKQKRLDANGLHRMGWWNNDMDFAYSKWGDGSGIILIDSFCYWTHHEPKSGREDPYVLSASQR